MHSRTVASTASRLARLALTAAAALSLAGGCGDDTGGDAPFLVRESVQQLHVTHATPGSALVVVDASGKTLAEGTVDKLGSLIFRHLPPGSGYRVRSPHTTPPATSRALRVMSAAESQPGADFYRSQKLVAGSGYIKTRDGTLLSIYVTLPHAIEEGPFPTVVDYSGYDPSKPGAPLGNYTFLCGSLPSLCDAPNDPSALIASLFGYATVSVNIRGTGCSGGAYDYFETLQLLDGYDVIETVAAQPWVANHKVGMTGLSYPGISQLFVAATQPPGLAAITPLSVIGNTATTLAPGAILNDGFAVEWVRNVLDKADPYGQGWEKAKVAAGDAQCAENQLLHGQKVNNVAEAYDPTFYTADVLDPLNPTAFADRITVPVFTAGAWQDEQTGPFFVTLLDRFAHAPVVRATVYNGIHPDGFQPAVLAEWKNFLDLYVARRVPVTDKLVRSLTPLLFKEIFRTDGLTLPPDRFAAYKTYGEALAAYEKEPPVRVLFESGAGGDPGLPGGTFEKTFAKWPPPETRVLRYYLREGGALSDAPPTATDGGVSFALDPAAGDRGILAPGGDVWDVLPKYDWKPLTAGQAVAFVTPPLAKDAVLLGTASADLWVRSTADDADLQVTLTEVRPDGKEMYVQSGWLRASYRALEARSTELWPSITYLAAMASPLAPGTWTKVRVPIPGFGQVVRAGSRLRVSIDTPGGTRAEWRFLLKKFPGPVTHSIAIAADRPSSVALPLVDGLVAPTALPKCPSLRGQPCRAYVPLPM